MYVYFINFLDYGDSSYYPVFSFKKYTLKEFEEKYKILKFEREDENGELTPIRKERKGRDNGLYR